MYWNIEAITGYKPQTTFWMDFSIADQFGVDAIKDTYKRSFENWKSNYVYLTEFVMVLNWKLWQHYDAGRDVYASLYDELYSMANSYAMDNLHGDELSYFYQTTD